MKIINMLSAIMVLFFTIYLFVFRDVATNKDIVTMILFMGLHISTRFKD